MSAKDSLAGVALLMLDQARSTLDRANEATSLDQAKALIAEAQEAIEQVVRLAAEAADS
jgi:hypothetical protein